jgi:hypothetical protein
MQHGQHAVKSQLAKREMNRRRINDQQRMVDLRYRVRRRDCNLSGKLELALRCKIEDTGGIVEYYLSVAVSGHAYDEVCV